MPVTYLDHAATTPLHPAVADQLARDLAVLPEAGNPSSQHAAGRRAGALLSEARARLARALGVDTHEVLFTSGGTEADALVVAGRALAARRAGTEHPGLVVSAVEHPAVLDTARRAEEMLGARLTVLGVDAAGRVSAEALSAAVEPGTTALVSVMAANNETGAVEDLAGLVAAVRAHTGTARPGEPGWVAVHADAVAAVGRVAVDVHNWGLDAVSLSGHKLGAPVGTGALVLRREVTLVAPTGGGLQERGTRSGTQDVVGARALALAVELAVAERQEEAVRLEALRSRLLAGATVLEGVHATLPDDAAHLPGTAHLWVEDTDAEALLMALDLAGVEASAGSACHAGVFQPSEVVLAMGLGEEAARAPLRLSMGRTTTVEDIDRFLAVLPGAVDTARRARRGSSRYA
ncbi:cysteine desulfurase family protein [Actinomyces respiraculi]|uniref:cysteine desulfurase family protein n=1 Tax=Actinomyces respiraculi TaxID=2744574 RepID=UPI00141DE6AB